jgi:hypothetical protein
MARRRSPALTCRNLAIPAGRDPGASESRALGDAGSTTPANATCRLPLEEGAPSSILASSAADMCTPQKHTAAHASGSIDAANTPRSHTSEACSPSILGVLAQDGAPSAAVSPAVAREAGGAVLVDASANEPTCANTAPRGRCQASDEAAVPPPVDPPFSAGPPGVPTAVSHRNETEKGDSGASSGIAESRISETAISGSEQRQSAGLVAHRVLDVLVAGAGVDHRALDALVPGDPLGQEDVLGPLVDVGDPGVAERVEPERLIEAGALLPGLEHETEGPGRDSLAEPRDEQRGIGGDALAVTLLPDDELIELVDQVVWEKDLLALDVHVGALEHAQGDAPANPAVLVDDVADVERGDLVFPERGAERDRQDHVVAEPAPVLAGELEQATLLGLDEGAGRATNSGSVGGHEEPPRSTHASGAGESKASAPGPLLVAKRTEEDLLDWLGTELGFLTGIGMYNEEPLLFEPYQTAFLESKARYRWVEKARQVGFSFLFACEAIARCHLRDAHTAVMVSYNLEDAKEKVAYARQLAEELPLAYKKRLVADSKTELGFLSNSASKRVSRIISNPSKAPRGKRGDLYLDELAHYANDREVYKGSTALILRSRGQLTGCSSPLGRRGVFWEIARQELRSYKAYWRQRVPWWLCRFFCVDVARAAKDAPLMPTEDRVRTFGTKDIQDQFDSLPLEDFQEEFEVSYSDESYSFYPYELILPCTTDDLVLADDFATFGDASGRLVAGFDVGRKRDLSELSIFEELSGKKVCRLLRSYDRVPFADQEADLRRMLTMLPIGRLSIDQNGIGMHLAENLGREFGQVVPETFSNESKEIWATDFKILLQRKDVVLPKDRQLVAQIHSIKRRLTPTGKPSFEPEREEIGRGHADRFWSVALACQKERGPLPGTLPEVHVRVIG